MKDTLPSLSLTVTLDEFILLFGIVNRVNLKLLQSVEESFPDDLKHDTDYRVFRRLVKKLHALNLDQARRSAEAWS